MPNSANSSVCWRGTEDVIAGLETACLHTSSVYTSGSHSSIVSSLSKANGTTSPTVVYGRSLPMLLTHSLLPCLLLVISLSIFFDADHLIVLIVAAGMKNISSYIDPQVMLYSRHHQLLGLPLLFAYVAAFSPVH